MGYRGTKMANAAQPEASQDQPACRLIQNSAPNMLQSSTIPVQVVAMASPIREDKMDHKVAVNGDKMAPWPPNGKLNQSENPPQAAPAQFSLYHAMVQRVVTTSGPAPATDPF